jgi:hypothetical protein
MLAEGIMRCGGRISLNELSTESFLWSPSILPLNEPSKSRAVNKNYQKIIMIILLLCKLLHLTYSAQYRLWLDLIAVCNKDS